MARRGRPRNPVSRVIRGADELRAWREGRGLTRLQLGELLDVNSMTVYRWEAGTTPIPRTVEYALRYLDKH